MAQTVIPFCKYAICALLLSAYPILARAQGLEQLIFAALGSHPAAQAQDALVLSARAAAASARWQFFPTPSLGVESASAGAGDTNYQTGDSVVTMRLQQPVWSGGRLTAGLGKAEANITASRASLEEARQQLASRVVQAYGDWLSAHLKMVANDRSLATHERLLAQVKRRAAQGASADSDTVLANSRLQSVTADLSVAQAQRDIALGRLEQLVGRRVEVESMPKVIALPRRYQADRQANIDLALSASPSLQRARAQADVRLVEVAERRAALSPEVFVRAERQYGNASVSNSPPVNRLFIGLSTTLGAGLSGLSNIDAAKAQHQAALADVQVQARALSDQVLADHVLATSAEQRLEALSASLAAARAVSESFDRQFLAGRRTWLDVMNSARELAQIEVQLADIRAAQIVATWRLAIYVQGMSSLFGTSP